MPGARTRVFALLGDPVHHSLSPAMHNAAFRVLGLPAVYLPIRCSARDLPGLMGGLARSGGGGNVTVPHKELAGRLVQSPADAVREAGACNTFWRHAERVRGSNPHVDGVIDAHAEIGDPRRPWLLAGRGGKGRAVAVGAGRLGASISG